MASNKMLIDASHREETRVVVLRGNRIDEFDFESQNKRQLKGNIYLAKVTRVEPSLQAAFVDYGGNRHGFLAFNEIHPDYYQIPVADRQALLDEEAEDELRAKAEDEAEPTSSPDEDNGDGDEVDSETEEEDAGDGVEAKADPAPKRSKRRSRRKTAVSKTNDGKEDVADSKASDNNADDNNSDDEDGEDNPSTMAAIIETDSISEPASDEDTTDDEPQSDDADEAEASKKPVKNTRRSTRRPRKGTKAKTDASETEGDGDAQAPADVPQETVADATPEADSAADNSAEESEPKETKPRPRRKRKPTRGRGKKDSAQNAGSDSDSNSDNTSERVESSGQEDAMEELPRRRRSRRQYKIQEVIKRRQVLLVQVVKEERGNKGAALTTYLSLAGRYSVLMPNTARGGGISRKITNAVDRKRLKAIANGLEVPEGMGVILRTAGASRDNAEIERDFEYLMRLWESVRELTLSSSAPCLVYEEGSLIKRSIRDLYGKNSGDIMVAGEEGYSEARAFMEMLMPSHVDKVKLYQEEQAMFARFGVEQQLDKMLSQQVTLKSGGYLVIDQTEALVAVDVNSGRATREHSIEDTALQTNLETAEEVARQLRLRDLAGLIVIDFIDMEENRNNRAVEKKLKECLKHDRARIQVGRISHFGLLEMSRQRMRASVLESTMDVCPHCQGKGHMRSDPTVGLHILRSIEEHLLNNSRFDIVIKCPGVVAMYMLNSKRQALMETEIRFGVKIIVEESRELLGEAFTIEKGEPSTGERKPLNHIQAGQVSDLSDGDEAEAEAETQPKRKRRRKRGRGAGDDNEQQVSGATGVDSGNSQSSDDPQVDEPADGETDDTPIKKKRTRGKRGGRNTKKSDDDQQSLDTGESANAPSVEAEPVVEETAPASRNRRPRKKKVVTKEVEQPAADQSDNEDQQVDVSPEPKNSEPPRTKRRATKRAPAKTAKAKKDDVETASQEPSGGQSDTDGDEAADTKTKKKGGWWSRNGFFG